MKTISANIGVNGGPSFSACFGALLQRVHELRAGGQCRGEMGRTEGPYFAGVRR